MTDGGSFVPLGKAGQAVIVNLNARRPAAGKARAEELAKLTEIDPIGAELVAKMAEYNRMKFEERKAEHKALCTQQAQAAVVDAMRRLEECTSTNACVGFVEGALVKMTGGRK